MGGILHRVVAALVLLLAACCGCARAEEPARIWRVCVTDTVVPPYLYNDPTRPGLAERILVDAGRQVGLSVLLLRFPLRRCGMSFELCEADAMLVGATPDKSLTIQLPSKAGALDTSRRLAHINVVWVRRNDSQMDWDGTRLTHVPPGKPPLVGARVNAFAGKDRLLAMGLELDDNALNTHQALAKLVAHRVDVVLGLQEEVEYALHDPQLSDLVVLPRAYQTLDYYVGAHRELPPDLQAKVEAWWATMAQLREQRDYRYSGAGN